MKEHALAAGTRAAFRPVLCHARLRKRGCNAVTNPLEACLKDVRDIRGSGAPVAETTFYPALSNLLNEIGKNLNTRHVNFREGVRGCLFQGRFYSCPLDERHFMAAVRYVERNPVRAGLAKEAWQYAWSSAAYHVGVPGTSYAIRSMSYV